MVFLIAFLIFIIIVAGMWFLGTWNVFINLVITILAGTIASSYFENVAVMIENADDSLTYVADFLALWLCFFGSFIILRIFADGTTKYRMNLNMWVDFAMRTVLGMVTAWVFICFTLFTLHTAPLPLEGAWGSFQEDPDTYNLGVGPDRLWMSYVQSRSRGALAESKNGLFFEEDKRDDHPDDADLNCRVFDPFGDFIYKFHHRREEVWNRDELRVNPDERSGQ